MIRRRASAVQCWWHELIFGVRAGIPVSTVGVYFYGSPPGSARRFAAVSRPPDTVVTRCRRIGRQRNRFLRVLEWGGAIAAGQWSKKA